VGADVRAFLSPIDDPISRPILRKALFLLDQLIEIGVGYLSLERQVGTLSGGECQRVKMAKQLDCELVDLLYILDEPSIGLHPRDTERLMEFLRRLKEKGNSVFVVEHDPDIIRAAEWIVDMGPRAGTQGGMVVYNGEAAGFAAAESVTARCLAGFPAADGKGRTPDSAARKATAERQLRGAQRPENIQRMCTQRTQPTSMRSERYRSHLQNIS
jgi:excinuclease UvrABC ATPase subunit